jgi:hypothetical protein
MVQRESATGAELAHLTEAVRQLRQYLYRVRQEAAEPLLKIEAEAREYAAGVKYRAEIAAQRSAGYIIDRAQFQARNIIGDATERVRELKAAEEDVERRRQEMISPHAPALALLQSILGQYPLPQGDRLPTTAFLSACALVASLMGTNPVDLALNMSGGSFEFSKKQR